MRYGARAYRIEDIEAIGSMGLDFAEVNLTGDQCLLEDVKVLNELAGKWGIQYLVHAPNEGDPTDLRHLEGEFIPSIFRILDGCRAIESPILTMHFWLDGRFLPADVLSRKMALLEKVSMEGRRLGVQVCIENLSERLEDLRPLFSRCSQLGMTLDLGHGEILSAANSSFSFMEAFAERIRHVHVHDNRGGSRVDDDLHLPLGEGNIDFPPLIGALLAIGYDNTITVEVPVDQVASSLQRLRLLVEGISPRMSHAAQRVQHVLDGFGLRNRVIEWKRTTSTAREAAETLGTTEAHIAKSLVFSVGEGHILVIASGVNRVSEKKLSSALGSRIRMASPQKVEDLTGFPVGGVPPVGHRCRLATFIDQDLLEKDFIWAAAGTPTAVFRLTPQELLHITKGRVMDLKQ